MRFLIVFLLSLALAGIGSPQQQQPAPTPSPTVPKSGPTLPEAPSSPIPVASSATALPSGVWYVVHWTDPCVVLCSPEGVLTVKSVTGPVKMLGKFSDNPTQNIEKDFTDKYIYLVQCSNSLKKPERAELLVIWPTEAGKTYSITRRTIDALSPQPVVPPTPTPDPNPPGPTPDPNPPVVPPGIDPAVLATVQAAYSKDPDPNKAVNKGRLDFFYKDAILTSVPNKDITTWGAFFRKMQDGRKAMIQEGLADTRMALGNALFDKTWTTDPTKPFDDAARKAAAESLAQAAKILETIK